MSLVPVYLTNRTAEYSARTLLRRLGYRVIRVAEPSGIGTLPFQLIAWKSCQSLLFIRVRSPRKDTAVREELRSLSQLASSGEYPGEIQYWIREPGDWRRYRILAGGCVMIPGAVYETR
jgi:hypothetical protein